MYVIYVTSETMSKKWGTVTEVGANWITQRSHKIFNKEPLRPEHPLDDAAVWHTSSRYGSDLQMDEINADIFCVKIEEICDELGYTRKTRIENKNKLKTLVTIVP